MVCNSQENSIRIVSYGNLAVRKTLTAGVGAKPWDVVATPRQVSGGMGTYFAFITRRVGNTVSIYESGRGGSDAIIKTLTEGPSGPFLQPIGIVSNRRYGNAAGNRVVVLHWNTLLPLTEIPVPGVEIVETFFD